MLFEKQQHQADCVENILTVLKETENITNLSALTDSIKTQHSAQSAPLTAITDMPRLDVLMETGTGKTFTYIQTMYELNKQHSIHKFIIFVPRLAIRAGVLQNIKLTADYFFQTYKKRLKHYIYEGKGLAQIASYIRDKNDFSVLILTSASITKDKILTRRHETIGEAGDQSPLDSIAKLKPVIFIDEPHLLKGDEFIKSYDTYFKDRLCIRFGATYPTEEPHQLSNVVYTLDSISAFNQYLVKKIRVSTIINDNTGIRFLEVKNKRVRISYFKDNIEHKQNKDEQSTWVSYQQDLGAITSDHNYHDISIVKATQKEVFLSNNTKQQLGKNDYTLDDETIRAMIKCTIATHFVKEATLFKQGIKTLSLFFIPNIRDFRNNDPLITPRIKKIFEEQYEIRRKAVLQQDLESDYKKYLEGDYQDGKLQVHDGYFSGDKGSSDAKEAEGINLILKDKENLLSTKTPLRFIFSVWALQEGWDNPNIFNICKLANSSQETSRRQQVGRGLRLAVNTDGKRQTIDYFDDNAHAFYGINLLDMIVSSEEKNFIAEIQAEINSNSYGFVGDYINSDILKAKGLNLEEADDFIYFLKQNKIIQYSQDQDCYLINAPIADFMTTNREILPNAIKNKADDLIKAFAQNKHNSVVNAQEPKKVTIRKSQFTKFKALWEQITREAEMRYQNIAENAMIKTIQTQFNKERIAPVQIKIQTQTYNHKTDEVENDDEQTLGDQTFFNNDDAYLAFIQDFSAAENLPLCFVLKIMNGLHKDNIANNPKQAKTRLSQITKNAIHDGIIHNIGYQFNKISISNTDQHKNKTRDFFYDKTGKPKTEILQSKIGRYESDQKAPAHYLYDKVVYDSDIEETVITQDPEGVDNKTITVFAKLPPISIPTPYKRYNPDFGYAIEDETGKKLFLIVETKGYDTDSAIPAAELKKIDYAEKFFQTLNEQLQQDGTNAEIVFKKRINKQDLSSLLQDITNEARK